MNKMMDFESWTNQFGSIKQVYTTSSLLQMLSTSDLFFLANEGDAILQESSFFNPSDTTADVKQGTLIDCKFLDYSHYHHGSSFHILESILSCFRLGWKQNSEEYCFSWQQRDQESNCFHVRRNHWSTMA